MGILDWIFSVKNDYGKKGEKDKVLTIFGVQYKFHSDKKEYYSNLYNKKIIPTEGFIYEGNPEYGLCSLDDRIKETEGDLEYQDMNITNKAIGDIFIKDAKTVVNIGSGVGTFEWQNAKKFPDVKFVASEFDESETSWAKENRSIENVEYCSDDINKLIENYGKFDLAVCVDVIEHVYDYKSFLENFVKLSDRAVISTPNRDRYTVKEQLIRPPYNQHVREWNAGELYFILKMYYKSVKLYSFPNPFKEELIEVGIYSSYEKLVAYCEN